MEENANKQPSRDSALSWYANRVDLTIEKGLSFSIAVTISQPNPSHNNSCGLEIEPEVLKFRQPLN